MATESEPVVGNWYERRGKGQRFEVVAVDPDEGMIEVQHFDGDVEEMDFDTWYDDTIEPVEPPVDWTGPVDDVEHDDLHYTETSMSEDDWNDQLQENRTTPEQARSLSDEESEERDYERARREETKE